MIAWKSRTLRAAACTLATALVCAGPAWAGTGGGGNSLDGAVFDVCGKWLMKLHDFGKLKLGDFNSYVPENFQAMPGTRDQPRITIGFGPTDFQAFVFYKNLTGVQVAVLISGTYEQRGSKVNFFPNATGVVVMQDLFRTLSQNVLFGDPNRHLVTDITYREITNPGKLRFKGRVKSGGNRLKVKFKAKLLYDIRFELNSEYPDAFNLKGRFKLRADSAKCTS